MKKVHILKDWEIVALLDDLDTLKQSIPKEQLLHIDTLFEAVLFGSFKIL